jgi:hypothetical protein
MVELDGLLVSSSCDNTGLIVPVSSVILNGRGGESLPLFGGMRGDSGWKLSRGTADGLPSVSCWGDGLKCLYVFDSHLVKSLPSLSE